MHAYLVFIHQQQLSDDMSFATRQRLIQDVQFYYDRLKEDGILEDEYLFTKQMEYVEFGEQSGEINIETYENMYSSVYKIKADHFDDARSIVAKDPRAMSNQSWSVLIYEIETIDSAMSRHA